ncbi:unnamed protein product [Caenorhabditis brenneri]
MIPSNQSVSCEDNELMKFMLKRAKRSETPMCIGQMCEEFIDENKFELSGQYYRARFMKMAPQIDHIRNYDIEDIAKLYFVTSLAPSSKFLKRLREIADVEVDAENRLVKFKGQKVRFEGVHEVNEKVKKFDKYKDEKAKKNIMLNDSRDFSTDSSNLFSMKPDGSPIKTDCSFIEYGAENSQSMSEIQGNLSAENNLRCSTIEKNIAQLFEEFSDPLAFQKEQMTTYQSPNFKNISIEANEENFSEEMHLLSYESDMKMLHFLKEKSKRSEFPLIMKHLWEEYVREVETETTRRTVQARFKTHLAPMIHRMEEFDFRTKVEMLYASGTPVNEQFLEQLHEHAAVELDENNHIIEYKFKNDDASQHRGSHAHSTGRNFRERKRSYHNTENSTKQVVLDELHRQLADQKSFNSIHNVKNEVIEGKYRNDNVFKEINPPQGSPKFPTSDRDSTATSSLEGKMTNKVENIMLTGKEEIAFPVSNFIAPDFRNFVPYDPQNPPLTAYFGGPAYHVDSLAHYPQLSEKFFAQFYPNSTPASRGFEELLSKVNQDNRQCKTVHVSEVFKQLKVMLLSLNTPIVNRQIEEIEQTIEDSMKSEERLPLSELHGILESCLIKISRKWHTNMDSEEEWKDSRDFLNVFNRLLVNLDASVFSDIENKIKEQVNNMELEHQIISVSDIQQIIKFLITSFSD